VWLVFGPQITVLERLGPFAGLSRSRQLVRGHWWRTAALVTVIAIIISVIYVILGIVAGIIVAFNPDQVLEAGALPWYVDFVVNPLLSGVTTPLAYSLFIATYYDLRNRHEGGDIAERIAAAAT
jgi:membrane protein implicated in regulation of membrane protease activity